MDQEYFTITLSSSDISYEGNTLAIFKTFLPKELLLDGEWSVGLAELHYTKSWFNVPQDEYLSIFDTESNMMTSPTKIPAGWYDDKSLLETLQKSISDWFEVFQKMTEDKPRRPATRLRDKAEKKAEAEVKPVVFKYPAIGLNDNTRQVELTSGSWNGDNRKFYIHLSESLANMLGLSRRKSYYRPEMKTNENV